MIRGERAGNEDVETELGADCVADVAAVTAGTGAGATLPFNPVMLLVLVTVFAPAKKALYIFLITISNSSRIRNKIF